MRQLSPKHLSEQEKQMTTTAFDDQFTAGTQPLEPVRQPYDIAPILRRNIADIEIALKRQAEREEAAEAELLAVREDNHSMMLEIDGLRKELARLAQQKPAATLILSRDGSDFEIFYDLKDLKFDGEKMRLYAAPVPAPAVPLQWREVMAELAADLQAACDAEYPHRAQYQSVMRKYNNDMEIVEKARALLQSADHSELAIEKVAPDCRNCANRGQVNGLSQESYCDGCVYQGRSWRKNHFVLAVKRRCEACAILPCSCK